MLGSPTIKECKTENIIDQLESLNCATWHPLFIRDYFSKVIKYVEENVKCDSVNKDNKWSYQYYIKKFLKTIPIDFNNYISVKNYIVLDNFIYHDDEGKNKYSGRDPKSVYDIFYSYCQNFKLDTNVWHDKKMKDIRDLHAYYKQQYYQYTFFTTDEKGLNTITSAYIYMSKKN